MKHFKSLSEMHRAFAFPALENPLLSILNAVKIVRAQSAAENLQAIST